MDTLPDPAITPLESYPEREEVRVSVNPYLLARARALDRDLSRTINRALESHVARYERRMSDEEVEAVMQALNERHEEFGVLSDEFSTL